MVAQQLVPRVHPDRASISDLMRSHSDQLPQDEWNLVKLAASEIKGKAC